MKWIGVGVLSFEGKLIKHGQDIPKSFPKKQLNKLKSQGKIGTIIERVDPEPIETPNKVQKTTKK